MKHDCQYGVLDLPVRAARAFFSFLFAREGSEFGQTESIHIRSRFLQTNFICPSSKSNTHRTNKMDVVVERLC